MRLWVPIGLAGLALCGCGGGEQAPAEEGNAAAPAATASAAPAACDVLTQADAAKALGRDVQRMESEGGPAGLDMCQYGYQGEGMMDMGQATVTVQPVDLASLKAGVVGQGFAVEPVAGLGDEAFWSPEAGLYVGKGQRSAIYLVGVGGSDPAADRQRAIDLAKATVARL